MEYSVLWKDEQREREHNKSYEEVDNFFENLYHHCNDDTTSSIDFNNLIYREGQHSYALDIMEAIKNKDILLIQAGVGIGKSFGYLLPIFHTHNNVKSFDKIIISTSSIALQEQLLNDIKNISEMLNIKIKADIAKGVNNYACLNRIYYRLDDCRVDEETKEILTQISSQIRKINSSDKSDLTGISEKVWEQIQLQSRGACSKCTYTKTCPFYQKQKTINDSNIIITNHANMAKNIIDKTELVQDVDMIVFDEAHKLAENIQGVRIGELDLENIKKSITRVSGELDSHYNNNVSRNFDEFEYTIRDNKKLFEALDKLFSRIMASASKNFFVTNESTNNENDYSITDTNRLGFRLTPTVNMWLEIVLTELNKIIEEIKYCEKKSQKKLNLNAVRPIKLLKQVFEDMSKGNDSTNIYWAEFYKKNRINIMYAPKESYDISKQVFSSQIPIILTSGTMLDSEKTYSKFIENNGLNKLVGRSITPGEEQKSPYDYQNNSLFYYNPYLTHPNQKEDYIKDLCIEISELIKMTNGKALILFTSKKTMNTVYEILKQEEFPFELLLQTDNNATEIKEQFSKDTDSCLFATGAFWEGIDIKGKSLSNLIITRLPFDQVDAVTQYQASKYAKEEQFKQVYFPNMLTKFQQAVGRLIRSDSDTGIVCCLDSRFDTYKQSIIPNIPLTNYTTDKKELYEFVDTTILTNENTNNKTKKLS